MSLYIPYRDKTQALIALEQGLVWLDMFSYQDTTSELFALWREQMLAALILLMGENAPSVAEWRNLRFEPLCRAGQKHIHHVWHTHQNYARFLLRMVLMQQKS